MVRAGQAGFHIPALHFVEQVEALFDIGLVHTDGALGEGSLVLFVFKQPVGILVVLFAHVRGLHLARGVGAVQVKGALCAAVQFLDVQIVPGEDAIVFALKAVVAHVAILLVGGGNPRPHPVAE